MISFDTLEVELPLDVVHIESVTMSAKLNEHTKCCIVVLIKDKDAEKYLKKNWSGQQIKIIKENSVVFVGKCTSFSIIHRNHVTQFKMEAKSFTISLDEKCNNRAFTDTSMTYKEVVQEVLSKYADTHMIYELKESPKIKSVLVQYQETDWEFLKRLASHFESTLVTCSQSSTPDFYFGLPNKTKKIELQNIQIDEVSDLEEFRKLKEQSEKSTEQKSFIGWSAVGKKYASIGTKLIYQGQSVYVTEIQMVTEKGEIFFRYKLRVIAGVRTVKKYNAELTGISLEAIVKERRDNELQLHFCINDNYKKSENNAWFSYVREVNSFYVLPEKESKVHVYFPCKDEKYAYAMHCLRIATKDAPYYSKILVPENKSFSTVDGQELLMSPQNIQVSQDQQKSIQVSLGKDGSVSITGAKINLQAGQTITFGNIHNYNSKTNPFKAKNISFSAKNVSLQVGATSKVEVKDEVHLYRRVKMHE